MSGTASAITAVAAVAGAAYSIYSGQKEAKAADQARNEARENAKKQEKAGQEAINRQNGKSVDAQGALDSARMAGKGGVGGTMLTGPSGVDPNSLALGKSTLLGG